MNRARARTFVPSAGPGRLWLSRKGRNATEGVLSGGRLGRATAASLRFVRAAFFLRSCRQRLTGLEPRRHPRPTHPGRRHERGKDRRDSLFLRFCVWRLGEPVFTSYVERANVISRARLQLSVAVELLHLWCHEEAVRTLRVMSARDL